MHSKCVFKHFNISFRLQDSVLGGCWICGLLFGVLLGVHHPFAIPASFCASLIEPPTMLAGTLIVVLPVLLTFLIFASRCLSFTYPLLFVYSLCYGFCGVLLSCVWGDSAWLLRLLLLFSASSTSFLIWFLLLRYQQLGGALLWPDILFVLVFLCCISVINKVTVSPVLTALFDYLISLEGFA